MEKREFEQKRRELKALLARSRRNVKEIEAALKQIRATRAKSEALRNSRRKPQP
jgi:hypothetical protein